MLELRGGEITLTIGRGLTRGQQQSVSIAEGDIEGTRKQLNHLPARLRTSGLEEAEMPT